MEKRKGERNEDIDIDKTTFARAMNCLCFHKGVQVMNAIEEGKFPLLLNRIAQFLSSDSSCKPFTDAEEAKLESSLEISRNEVELVINTILEVFNKCAYYKIKPGVLAEQLEASKLNQKKIEAFTQVWTSFAKGIVDNFRQKCFLPQLSHMAYVLSVETASPLESRGKVPQAQLQFGLSNEKTKEEINIEFTHDELYNFYKKLEQIQEQLDSLK